MDDHHSFWTHQEVPKNVELARFTFLYHQNFMRVHIQRPEVARQSLAGDSENMFHSAAQSNEINGTISCSLTDHNDSSRLKGDVSR